MVVEVKPKNKPRDIFVLHVETIETFSGEVRINLAKDQNDPGRVKEAGMLYKVFLPERNLITMTHSTYLKQIKLVK